jgi:hypothetical protein
MSETPEPPDEFQPPVAQPSSPEPYVPYGQAPYGEPTTAGQPWIPAAPTAPADLGAVDGPAPILVGFTGPQPQARLTVLVRGILVIPHVVVLAVLGIAAIFVAFIGWWAALFTGQLPDGMHNYLTGYTRWTSRLTAYLYFLTDQYPPFSLEDADYPVRLFAKRTRLNRAAVFFRFILVIPSYVVAGVSSIGLLILSIVAWVITLITGQLPAGLHEAFSSLVRYNVRYGGYAFLITPEQPWHGLYGDQTPGWAAGTGEGSAAGGAPAGAVYGTAADGTFTAESPTADATTADVTPADATTADATAADATTPHATTADAPQADETATSAPEPAYGFGAAADAPAPTPHSALTPYPAQAAYAAQAQSPWDLLLSSTGKMLVTVALIVGVIGYAGDIAWQASRFASTTGNRITAFNSLNGNYNKLGTVLKAFQTKTEACGQSISCVTALDNQVATAFTTFGTGLQNAGIPSSYSADATALAGENGKVQADFAQLATATSVTQYESIVSGLSLNNDLSAWQAAYNTLASSLDQP